MQLRAEFVTDLLVDSINNLLPRKHRKLTADGNVRSTINVETYARAVASRGEASSLPIKFWRDPVIVCFRDLSRRGDLPVYLALP